MADFVVVVSVLLAVVMKSVLASTRTLILDDDRCFGPFNPTPRENFKVIHKEDRKSSICKDMSFSGWDDVDKVRRESCVKVTDFQLDCSQTLEYRAGTNRGEPAKSYDCRDTVATIPVFCTFELLYIRIKFEVDRPRENQVKYTVYSGAEKESEKEDFPVFALIGPLIIVFVVVGSLAFAFCLRRRNARRFPASAGRAVYTPGQPQQVNVHHYYHPVNQTQAQGQAYPTQGSSGPPQQTQGYNAPPQGYSAPPQGYSAPPQQTQGYNAPPQRFQTYPLPSASVAYPLPRGQEFSPLQTGVSAHQQTNDTGEPPSYEEVTKKKF